MKLKLSHLKKPWIVGTLTGHSSLSAQINKAKQARIDLLEIRLDTLSTSDLSVVAQIKKKIRIPLLLTDRSWTEQGKPVAAAHRRSNLERASRLYSVLEFADVIDVEIRQTDFAKNMTYEAHRRKKLVMHSYHDFKSGGNQNTILRLAQLSKKLSGDIFKVAVMPRNEDELAGFLSWSKKFPQKSLVLIGMGRIGAASRFLGFSFGSIFTYGHLGTSAAPGQPAVKDLRRAIDDIYGR